MNNNRDEVTIGEIGFGTVSGTGLLMEVSPGRFNLGNPVGKCRIEVYSNEGQIPHFHIIGESKSKKFECCPCIYDAVYFNHGTKIDRLSNKQLIILNNWLNSPCDKFGGAINNWHIISSLWEMCHNPMTNVPKNPVQPNYSNMINMRN